MTILLQRPTIVFVQLLLMSPMVVSERCPSPWTGNHTNALPKPYRDYCYQYFTGITNFVTYAEAKSKCAARDAVLAEPIDSDVQEFLLDTVVTTSHLFNIWLPLIQNKSGKGKDGWGWDDDENQVPSWSFWYTALHHDFFEKCKREGSRCSTINLSIAAKGRWTCDPCDAKYNGVICRLYCPAGQFYNSNTSIPKCADCFVGSYRPNDTVSVGSCTPCKAGTSQSKKGQRSCSVCPANQYQDLTGQASCKPCQPGFCSSAGATSCDTPCPTTAPVTTRPPTPTPTSRPDDNLCISSPPCLHGGTCIWQDMELPGFAFCNCDNTGYTGQFCQNKLSTEDSRREDDLFYISRMLGYIATGAAWYVPPFFLSILIFALLDSINWYVRRLLAARERERRHHHHHHHHHQERRLSEEEELAKIPNRFVAALIRIIVFFGRKRIVAALRERRERLERDEQRRMEAELRTDVITRIAMRNAQIDLRKRSQSARARNANSSPAQRSVSTTMRNAEIPMKRRKESSVDNKSSGSSNSSTYFDVITFSEYDERFNISRISTITEIVARLKQPSSHGASGHSEKSRSSGGSVNAKSEISDADGSMVDSEITDVSSERQQAAGTKMGSLLQGEAAPKRWSAISTSKSKQKKSWKRKKKNSW